MYGCCAAKAESTQLGRQDRQTEQLPATSGSVQTFVGATLAQCAELVRVITLLTLTRGPPACTHVFVASYYKQHYTRNHRHTGGQAAPHGYPRVMRVMVTSSNVSLSSAER
jgi:hypothetical protein